MIISHLEFTLLKDDLDTDKLATESIYKTFDICSRIAMRQLSLDNYKSNEQEYLKLVTKHLIYIMLLTDLVQKEKSDINVSDVITYIFEKLNFSEDFHQELLLNSNKIVELNKTISDEIRNDLYSIAQITVSIEIIKHFVFPIDELKIKLVPNVINEEIFNILIK